MKPQLLRVALLLLPATCIALTIHATSPLSVPPPTVEHTQVSIPLTTHPASSTTQPDLFDKPQDMKKLVDTLAQRAADLEQENQLLKHENDRLLAENRRLLTDLELNKIKLGTDFKLPPFTLTPPQQTPEKQGKPFQFNGQTVYIEPITQGQGTLTINPPKSGDLIDDHPKQNKP